MEVWRQMGVWYNKDNKRPPAPTPIMIDQIIVERVELYQQVHPPRGQHPSVSGPITYWWLHTINERYWVGGATPAMTPFGGTGGNESGASKIVAGISNVWGAVGHS